MTKVVLFFQAATAALATEELLRTNVNCFSYVPHRIDTQWTSSPKEPLTPAFTREAFFKRLFKKNTGLSMREWRRQNTSQHP